MPAIRWMSKRIREPRSVAITVIAIVGLCSAAWILARSLDNATFAVLGSAATAIAVVLAGLQVRIATQQACVEFEDELGREYRTSLESMPASALLGGEVSDESYLLAFYRYFDLTNAQVFLRRKGRISRISWEEWREGIEENMKLPAFAWAWKEISRRVPGRFNELAALETAGYKGDPWYQ